MTELAEAPTTGRDGKIARIPHWIGGTRVDGASGRSSPVYDPARGVQTGAEAVVADGGGGADPFLEVARLEQAAVIRRAGPDPREAVRLELEAHEIEVRVVRVVPLLAPDLRVDPEDALHVVADLVGDHVRGGEVARCAEAP